MEEATRHQTDAHARTFIERWQGVSASELSTAQSFVRELCELLGKRGAPPHARAYSTQFSTCRPGTRSNSRVLLVTRIQPSARACAASHRSLLPMGWPCFCKVARIWP